jgi:protein-tyrosine-phosphatase
MSAERIKLSDESEREIEDNILENVEIDPRIFENASLEQFEEADYVDIVKNNQERSEEIADQIRAEIRKTLANKSKR